MSMKKIILIFVGAVVLGLLTVNVSAGHRINELPNSEIIEEKSVEDVRVEDQLISLDPDEDLVIAPNPIELDEDLIDEEIVIMPYDSSEFIGINDEELESNNDYKILSIIGAIGLVGIIGFILIIKRSK